MEVFMIVSTKGRYALRVMIDLAEHQSDKYIPLQEIADRQGISKKYLEIILRALVNEKFIIGLRGKGGGYKLAKAPEQYTVGSILEITEGELSPVSCLEKHADVCPRMGECRTISMWKELDTIIHDFFNGYTIADLMKASDGGNNYVI